MAVQGFTQRNLLQLILWKVASPRMRVLQIQECLLTWEKYSHAHRQVYEQQSKRYKKEWWQKCSSDVEGEWFALERRATCCQPWQRSREIGVTRYQPWHLSWVEMRICWTLIIQCTTIWVWVWGLCPSRHQAADVYLTEELRNRSNVWNSRNLLHVTLKFETKIFRSDIFVQVNLMSVAPTLQNLRIGLRRRHSGKDKVLAKQRRSWSLESKFKERGRAKFFSPSEK